jgi:hypothetical protein
MVKCKICKKPFVAKQWYIDRGWAQFCTIPCKNKGQEKGKFVLCSICGKESWKMPKQLVHSKSGKFFCSKSCQTVWRNKRYSGSNHAFWKNGITMYRKTLRSNNEPERCTICKESDTRVLQAHHKNKDRSDNRVENLVWLCINCHRLVHLHNQKLPAHA